MKGDFSRNTFRRDKHYSGVLMQQGRVQLDADFNEQQAIIRHRVQAETVDVIGKTGTPRDQPGFTIKTTEQGRFLVIGAGRFYLNGLVCENEEDVRYTDQPDRKPGPNQPKGDGLHIVYLEAWERHITALEDADLAEPALGGPDTTTRTRVVWQVKTLKVDDPGSPVSAQTQFAEWDALVRKRCPQPGRAGRLSAQTFETEVTGDDGCLLPPSAGYRGLENQLYRVEVHKGGTFRSGRATNKVTFKWSRDNGTVVSALDSPVEGSSEAILAEIGKDDLLTFASSPLPEWVEVSDDNLELAGQRGQLMRVKDVDPVTRKITFDGPLPELGAALNPFVRRWDQRAGGTSETSADGVKVTGEWQELEDGVQVRFADGRYNPGDYWLIPARTAIGGHTGGVIWPTGEDGAPAPQLADGAPHYLTRLALVRRENGAFRVVDDARPTFPPFTDISASDVRVSGKKCGFGDAPMSVQEAVDVMCQRNGSLCTLLLGPGDDLATAIGLLDDIPSEGPLDALIGLRAGTYKLSEPLQIKGRGHIRLVGIGPGTRIVAPDSERAIEFINCTSVHVSSICVEAGVSAHKQNSKAVEDEKGGTTTPAAAELIEKVSVSDQPITVTAAALAATATLTPGRPPGGKLTAAAGLGRGTTGEALSIVYDLPRVSGGAKNLGGALTFVDCPTVHVEDSVVTCAGGPLRSASCITVRNNPDGAGQTMARVRDCVLEVGHLQVGVLAVNVARSRVTDNLIRAAAKPADDQLLVDLGYQALLRRALIDKIRAEGEDTEGANVTISYGGYEVHAWTDPTLKAATKPANRWDEALAAVKPSVTSSKGLAIRLEAIARDIVKKKGGGEGGSSSFQKLIETLLEEDPATASQGVTVAGTVANDVVVSGNEIQNVHEGVRVGLSSGTTYAAAGNVTVRDNVIGVRVGTSATQDRLAVLVGNSDRVTIDGNVATLERTSRKSSLPVEGIRVFGTIGRRVLIRHNHLEKGFNVGVTFAPLNEVLPKQPLWIITDNIMEATSPKVEVPTRSATRVAPANPGEVRKKVRCVDDNFA